MNIENLKLNIRHWLANNSSFLWGRVGAFPWSYSISDQDSTRSTQRANVNFREYCTASLGPDLLWSEKLGCLKCKDGVALLNDLKVVVVVTEGAMKAIKVHFSEDNLHRDGEQKHCMG